MHPCMYVYAPVPVCVQLCVPVWDGGGGGGGL